MHENLNLTPERGPNVWEKRPESARPPVQPRAAVGGAVMLAAGAAAAFFGGRMLYRAVRDARGSAMPLTGRRARLRAIDVVTEGSEESFPASDPPSWNATAGSTLDRR